MIKPFEVFGFKVGWSWAAEVGTLIIRLIGNGVFDQFPRLKIVIGHMGEGLPFFVDLSNEDVGRVCRIIDDVGSIALRKAA